MARLAVIARLAVMARLAITADPAITARLATMAGLAITARLTIMAGVSRDGMDPRRTVPIATMAIPLGRVTRPGMGQGKLVTDQRASSCSPILITRIAGENTAGKAARTAEAAGGSPMVSERGIRAGERSPILVCSPGERRCRSLSAIAAGRIRLREQSIGQRVTGGRIRALAALVATRDKAATLPLLPKTPWRPRTPLATGQARQSGTALARSAQAALPPIVRPTSQVLPQVHEEGLVPGR